MKREFVFALNGFRTTIRNEVPDKIRVADITIRLLWAKDYGQFIRLMRKTTIDVIVISHPLPAPFDCTVTEFIEQFSHRYPIVFVTEHAEIKDAVGFMRQGVFDYRVVAGSAGFIEMLSEIVSDHFRLLLQYLENSGRMGGPPEKLLKQISGLFMRYSDWTEYDIILPAKNENEFHVFPFSLNQTPDQIQWRRSGAISKQLRRWLNRIPAEGITVETKNAPTLPWQFLNVVQTREMGLLSDSARILPLKCESGNGALVLYSGTAGEFKRISNDGWTKLGRLMIRLLTPVRLKMILSESVIHLDERVRELNCIYRLVHLSQQPDLTIERYLEQSIVIIQQAWQFPDVTSVHISYRGNEYYSPSYETGLLQLSRPICYNNEETGIIEIYLSEEGIEFLPEESDLLTAIAEKIGGNASYLEVKHNLHAWEQKFRSVFESAEDAIIITNAEGAITYSNPATSTLFNYPWEKLNGLRLQSLLSEWNGNSTEQLFRQLIRFRKHKSGPKLVQGKGVTRSGNSFNVEITHSVWEQSGRHFFSFIIRDVTARLEMQQFLDQVEERYQLSVKGAGIGVWDWDVQSGHVHFNDIWAEMLGYQPDDIEPHVAAWEKLLHQDDRDPVFNALNAHFNGETEMYKSEQRLRTKSGKWKWILDAGKVIERDAEGSPVRMSGIHLDISLMKEIEERLRNSEERYRLLVDDMTDGMISCDVDGTIRFYNRAFSEMREELEPDSLAGSCFFEMVEKKPAWAAGRKLCDYLRERDHSINVEIEMSTEYGAIIPVELRTSPEYDGPEICGFKAVMTNLTERKRREEQINQLTQFQSGVIDSANVWLNVMDVNGNILTWNNAAERISGFSKSEVVGNNKIWDKLYPNPDYRKKVLNKIDRILKHAEIVEDSETVITTKAGHERVVSWYSRSLYNTSGEPIGTAALGVDVTARKKAEQELRAERDRVQTYLNIAGVMIVTTDRKGVVTLINRTAENILGYSGQELVGKNWIEAIVPVTERRSVERQFNHIIEANNNASMISENHVMTASGRERLIFWQSIVLRNEQGECIGMLSSGTDITIRKKAEEELQRSHLVNKQLINSITSILIVVDHMDCISHWNSVAETTFGLKKRELLQQYFMYSNINWDWRRIGDTVRRARESSQSVLLRDFSFTKPDGSAGFLNLNISPFRVQNNQSAGYIIFGEDITTHKIMESQLAQAQKLESIGQLAAGIAHEINTPTQFIGDNIQFLQDAYNNLNQLLTDYEQLLGEARKVESFKAQLTRMEESIYKMDLPFLREEIPAAINQSLEGVQRVTEIVRAMKEFSHPGIHEKTAIDINRAIASAVTVARNEWKYVAEVTYDFEEDLPPVQVLPGEFNQVILNILVNAAHAIAAKGGGESGQKGVIKVATRNLGSSITVEISDSGTGIPEAIHDKIFDPFFTTKEVGKGTGQGLAISHNVITKKHGGTLTFKSVTGAGTTFIITLPVITAAEQGITLQ
jgi:PAS domain S-box-containing protein